MNPLRFHNNSISGTPYAYDFAEYIFRTTYLFKVPFLLDTALVNSLFGSTQQQLLDQTYMYMHTHEFLIIIRSYRIIDHTENVTLTIRTQ